MGRVLAIRLPTPPAQDLPAVALAGVLALVVLVVGVYVLVARCLRDAPPAERPEILRALAELLGSLRRGERQPRAAGRASLGPPTADHSQVQVDPLAADPEGSAIEPRAP